MAVNIGPRIGIEGESQYRKELQGIIEKSKALKEEMNAVSKGFKEAGDDSTDFERKSKVLGKQIENQQQIIDRYRELMEMSADATGEASTETVQYETKLYKAQGTMADLQRQLSELTGEEDENADQTEEVGEAVEDTGEDMKEASEKTSIFAETLKSQLTAQAIINGIKAIGDAVREIADSVKEAFTSTVNWADELQTLSSQTGISTTELQKLEYMAGLVDVDVSTVTGSMRKLTKSMDSASTGTGSAYEAFQELGVSVKDADGNLRTSYDVFYDVIDALGQIQNPTERDAQAMEIFGKSAQELNPMIEQGSEALKAFGDEAVASGYVLSEDAVAGLEEVSDSFERIKNAGDSAVRNAFAPIAPAISEMLNQSIPSMQEFSRNVGAMFSGDMSAGDFTAFLMGKLNELVAWVTQNTPQFLATGMQIITSILNGLAQGDIAGNAMSIVTSIQNGISENLPQLMQAGMTLIMSLIQGLTEPTNLVALIESGLNLLVSLVQGILDAIPVLLESAPVIIENLVQALVESLPALINAGITLIDSLLQGIIETLPMIIEQGAGLIGTLVTGIIQAIPKLIQTAPQLIANLVTSIAKNLPQILSAGVTIIISLISGLIQAIPDIIASIPQIVTAIIDTFKQTDWTTLGKQVINGIISGIKGMLSSAVEQMKQVGTRLYETAKSFFKIGSPSKLFADKIGKMIPAGIEVGIDKEMPNTIRDMRDQMDGLVLGASASINGATAVSASGGVSNNYGGFTINISAQDGQSAQDIADEVMFRIQSAVQRREAVFA